MGVRIIYDNDAEIAALYCSTTGVAFGPVFHDTGTPHFISGQEVAEQFLSHLPPPDPRQYQEGELIMQACEFVTRVQTEGKFWESTDADS